MPEKIYNMHRNSKQKEVLALDITFIIGNGFDLSCGIKSRYTDVYQTYCKASPKNECIRNFKETILNDNETWSDFEIAMAKKMASFTCEAEFLECLRDFKVYLEKYLLAEEKMFESNLSVPEIKSEVVNEIKQSLANFYEGINHNLSHQLSYEKSHADSTYYTIVSFNYTHSFETAIKQDKAFNKVGQFIHLHGELQEDIVLGVDNENQFSDKLKFPVSDKTRRAFVKPFFNQAFDTQRVDAAERIIADSQYICIFGWSMRSTDQTWIQEIIEWLREDDSHELILYQYKESTLTPSTKDEQLDFEEDAKKEFLQRIGLSKEEQDALFPQIHIPCGWKIFNIKEAIERGKQNKARRDAQREEIQGKAVVRGAT